MKTGSLIKASVMLICVVLCLFGCENTEKQSAVVTGDKKTEKTGDIKLDTPIEEIANIEQKVISEDENNEMIIDTKLDTPIIEIIDSVLKAISEPKELAVLSEVFLTGTWVNKEGFVCSYNDGYFVNSDGMECFDCTIKNERVLGTEIYGEAVSVEIIVIDNDTIKIGGFTAIRADSKEGKKYLSQISKLLVGNWIYIESEYNSYFEFKNGKVVISLLNHDESAQYDYEFFDGKLKFLNYKVTGVRDLLLYVRINEDTMSLFIDAEKLDFYRVGGQKAEAVKSGKSMVIGDWVYVSRDEKEISKWSFDSEATLTIKGYGNGENRIQPYSVYRDGAIIYLEIDGEVYGINYGYNNNTRYLYQQDMDNILGMLFAVDSEEGAKYLQKAETISQVGKITTRTYTTDFNNISHPEIASISLKLDCMSNIWLEDYISIEEFATEIDSQSVIIGSAYELVYKKKLKNAVITFTYNEEELPYLCENELVIVRMDDKSGKNKILKTKRNIKDNTVSAKITEDGVYYIADQFVMDGGIRDITEINPFRTEWARNCDTGDILSLLDLDYIRESEGAFRVDTASQLASVVYYINTTPEIFVYISLENDIDLSGYDWAPMGWTGGTEIDYPFSGYLVGNGFTISNLTIDTEDENVGLLGWETFSNVSGLTITNASIRGGSSVGIITGQAICGVYNDCHVDGTVDGDMAGSMIGYEANIESNSCTADVVVNGEQFDFLTWNEKQKNEIVIDNYITITTDENHTVTRPEVKGYSNLGWMVLYNGKEVLHRNAENEFSYQYFGRSKGDYEIYLTAYVSGQYMAISNTISYTID